MPIFRKDRIFVIAEMANSHDGSLNLAKQITEHAALAGVDAIKYQKFFADELAEPEHEYYDLYKRLEMKNSEWSQLIKFAKKKKLKVFIDVYGLSSAKQISKYEIDGFKIHSADLTNPYILEYFSKSRKPILVSAAGSLPNEIEQAIKQLQKTPKEIALMHGFQGYPTKLEELHLNRISSLKSKFQLPIGISDHIDGKSSLAKTIPIVGVGLGARIIEKHITLDRSKKGLDYYSSLNPNEFKEMVYSIRQVEKSLGSSDFTLNDSELKYRLNHKKNPIAKNNIQRGTKLDYKLFEFKRTKSKKSISYYEFKDKKTTKLIKKGITLTSTLIENSNKKIAAIVACRVDSTRLYAKPLQLINNFTILELLIKQIKKSSLIDDIVLAISDRPGNEPFVKIAKKHNIQYVIGDDIDTLSRIIKGAKYVNADTIFRVTSENPYIYWEGIDVLIKNHLKGRNDLSYYDDLPLGTFYEIINLNALEISHLKGSKRHRSELCTLYINEHQRKFKINKIKTEFLYRRPEIRLTVDTPQDLWVARIIHSKLGNGDKPISLKKIIKFLDNNKFIQKINSDIPIDASRIWN